MARHVFTIIAKIDPALEPQLRNELANVAAQPTFNPVIDFSQFCQLHFASFVIFDDLLVFENSVSGSRNGYLRALAEHARLERVYRYCTDFGEYQGGLTAAEERYRYLRDHCRKPNLRHVSTPYRTVQAIREDDAVVRQLESHASMPLSTLLVPSTQIPAVRESWNWEMCKPFVAIGAMAVLLGWLGYVWRHMQLWPILSEQGGVLLLDFLIPGIFGGLFVVKTWRSTPDAFRTRAVSVTVRAGVAIACLVLAMTYGTGQWMRTSLLLGAAVVASASLFATLSRCKSERIAALRNAVSATEATNRWSTLQRLHREISPHAYKPERARWREHLWNWRYWFLIPTSTCLAVWILRGNGYYGWLYWALLATFTIEAWWLTILVGWSPYSVWSRPRAMVIIVTAATAWLVLKSLSVLDPHPTLPLALDLQLPNQGWTWVVDLHPLIYGLTVIVTWLAFLSLTLVAPDVEVAPPSLVEQRRMKDVMAQEDHGVQNHMALAADVGTSAVRRASLRVFLWTLDRIFYRALLPDVYRGRLFGIPTVHSAQWVLLPDNRYLFLSNYDHSFTTYLNDFGTQIPSGIQKIWGICIGNPGMNDVERFKLFVRKAMVPHQVWYRAYEDVSVRRIWNNERIRTNLAFDNGDEEQMMATLRRFGGAPKIVPGLTHAAQ